MMKRSNTSFLLALFLATALFSCQGNIGQQHETGGQQETEPLPPPTQGLITHAGQLPEVIDYEGQFLQAAQWAGQGSTWYSVVSKYEQGEFFTPNWASRLNMYLFEIGNGQALTRRAFQAEAPNTYSMVELKGDRSQLATLPSTGTAYSIVYSICPDGEDPCSIYSSVIGAGGKYDFQVMENVKKEVYLEARDAMMAGIPEDVWEHMMEQLWGKE